MTEENNIESKVKPREIILPDIPTSWERFAILIVFGGMTVYMAYVGNTEAMMASAGSIATYFLSRNGA